MHYFVYNFLLTVTLFAAFPLLPVLLALRPRFRPGLAERCGWYRKNRLHGVMGTRPLWIHAASVGEVLAAGTLIKALKTKLPGRNILLSAFTDTGNEMALRRAGADAVIFSPIDHPVIVRRALRKFDPMALIIIETELWPNLLHEAFKRGVPVVLLSGRMSERAFHRYLRFRGLFCRVLRCFASLGVQTEEDAGRMTRLGAEAKRVMVTGNLKRAARARGVVHETHEGRSPGASKPRGPLIVAGSSHQGEEQILLEVFFALKTEFPDLQMAMAPRHPERFFEVEKLLLQWGVSFEKKSQVNGRMSTARDIMLVDTLGDLGKFYSLADVAFVGGSLVEVGGHNLLEPASFKKPVLFGPHTANFRALADEMKSSGGGIEVGNAGDLLREIAALLHDPEKRREAGEKAHQVAIRDTAVVERSLDLLRPYVDFTEAPQVQTPSQDLMAAYE